MIFKVKGYRQIPQYRETEEKGKYPVYDRKYRQQNNNRDKQNHALRDKKTYYSIIATGCESLEDKLCYWGGYSRTCQAMYHSCHKTLCGCPVETAPEKQFSKKHHTQHSRKVKWDIRRYNKERDYSG